MPVQDTQKALLAPACAGSYAAWMYDCNVSAPLGCPLCVVFESMCQDRGRVQVQLLQTLLQRFVTARPATVRFKQHYYTYKLHTVWVVCAWCLMGRYHVTLSCYVVLCYVMLRVWWLEAVWFLCWQG
jgi:hypothetical protein